jgi:SAM-dependent methyltransferase
MEVRDEAKKTIDDFGVEWTHYRDVSGFFGSIELFEDMVFPFLKAEDVRGCRVAEIGSGSGRIVNMLLRAGASHVIAIEPSEAAFKVLCQNIGQLEKVTCLQVTGDQIPAYNDLDYVFSIGVLHHIPYPRPVVEAAFKALRPGGHFLIWLYGKEGNALYLSVVKPLRVLTKRLPHFVLNAITWLIYFPMACYVNLCKVFPLPLRAYVSYVFGKMSPEKQRLIIYDQLRPACAKYYTRSEAEKLMRDGGFEDIRIHHRHGYSWTVIGTKP